jgi:hypothetical protein
MRGAVSFIAAWVLLLLSIVLTAAQTPVLPGFAPGTFNNRAAEVVKSSGGGYSGPGDVVSGATAWYGLRAYNAAYATGSNNAINVRRASDNSTQNIVILSTGNLDIATANTFAGSDATATCTIATTTATCTGASSTPHAGSTITGSGVTQPCYAVSVGSFVGGAGTVTLGPTGFGLASPCGTISSGVTLTFQYGLYVTKAYDQTGGNNCSSAACDVAQSATGAQPQLFPSCINSLPCIYFYTTNSTVLTGASNFTPATGNVSFGVVFKQPSAVLAGALVAENGTNNRMVAGSSSNTMRVGCGGVLNSISSVNNNVAHAANAFCNTSNAGIANVDGVETTGLIIGASGIVAGLPSLGSTTNGSYVMEGGFWDNVQFTSGNRTSQCQNQQAYYGAGNFGASC